MDAESHPFTFRVIAESYLKLCSSSKCSHVPFSAMHRLLKGTSPRSIGSPRFECTLVFASAISRFRAGDIAAQPVHARRAILVMQALRQLQRGWKPLYLRNVTNAASTLESGGGVPNTVNGFKCVQDVEAPIPAPGPRRLWQYISLPCGTERPARRVP